MGLKGGHVFEVALDCRVRRKTGSGPKGRASAPL